MKINTQQVRDTVTYIREALSQMLQVKNSVAQIRNRLDSRIIARSGVNYTLNQSISGLGQLQNRLQAIDSFLTDSATLYEMNETQLQQKARDMLNFIDTGLIYQAFQDNSQYSQFRQETKKDLDFVKGMKTIGEWLSGEKYDGILKKPLDALSKIDLMTEVCKGLVDYKDKDPDKLMTAVSKIGQKVMGELDKADKVSLGSVGKSFLYDSIFSMGAGWTGAIVDYAQTGEGTAGEIVWAGTGDAVIKAGTRAAELPYKVTTAVTFKLIDSLDQGRLRKSYEDLSDKKGLDAIIDVQKQLWVDEIYEKQIKPGAAKAIDNLYKGVSNTWNKWNTGCQLIGKEIGKWI